MISIASLLNPEASVPRKTEVVMTENSHSQSAVGRSSTISKRRRTTKSSPGNPQPSSASGLFGEYEIRYPPHEAKNNDVTDACSKFNVVPRGNFGCPKHIPYSSAKTQQMLPLPKTGFHVFRFTFKMPHEDKSHIVMWDCHTGLIKTTAFFRALKYPKTAPTKTIDANPGLRELCYNITGGSLLAQGYWMPFEVAKSLAATFCWQLRHILAIVFGDDFPSQCRAPDDPLFGRMVVSPALIAKLTMERQRSVLPRTPDSFAKLETSSAYAPSSLTGSDHETEGIKVNAPAPPNEERSTYWRHPQHQRQQRQSPTNAGRQVRMMRDYSDQNGEFPGPPSSPRSSRPSPSRAETTPRISIKLRPQSLSTRLLPSPASRPTASDCTMSTFSSINGDPRSSPSPSWYKQSPSSSFSNRTDASKETRGPRKNRAKDVGETSNDKKRKRNHDYSPESMPSLKIRNSTPDLPKRRCVIMTPADVDAAWVLSGMPYNNREMRAEDQHPRVEELVDEARNDRRTCV